MQHMFSHVNILDDLYLMVQTSRNSSGFASLDSSSDKSRESHQYQESAKGPETEMELGKLLACWISSIQRIHHPARSCVLRRPCQGMMMMMRGWMAGCARLISPSGSSKLAGHPVLEAVWEQLACLVRWAAV